MTNKLVLACAGAGKTERIIRESAEHIRSDRKVLVVTYTQNNQRELIHRFIQFNGEATIQFVVKGLYTFLLDDIVRPYQKCIFPKRIKTINFNKDGDPLIQDNRYKPGTAEKIDNRYNPKHYLTSCHTKVHTTYIAQLASRIISESGRKPIARLEAIYSHIYFDEVQDLVGWDYEVLKQLTRARNFDITCVGDFRQTIYQSAITRKQPKTNSRKLEKFEALGFEVEPMRTNWRSIQQICDFADTVHAGQGYESTRSLVQEVPEEYRDHLGIFIIKKSDVQEFSDRYSPVLLRNSVRSGIEFNSICPTRLNFGQAKGLSFPRVLILPTPNYKRFLKGDVNCFDTQRTDGARNRLYVAITRAKYSVGFIIDDNEIDQYGLAKWGNENSRILRENA